MRELALKESGGGCRKDEELMMVGAHCFVFFGALTQAHLESGR